MVEATLSQCRLTTDGVHVEQDGHSEKVLSYEELVDKAVEQLRLPIA